MDNDLYPNAGETYFNGMNIPDEQVQADEKQKAEVVGQALVIRAILAHLQDRIDFYSSIESIDEPSDPAVFMHIVAANRLVLAALIEEKEALELLVRDYK